MVGTGTEVGKTIVTAALARSLLARGMRVGVFKPFASDPARRRSGERFSTDADLLARAAGLPRRAEEVCGQLFSAPLAPMASAAIEGRRVDPAKALAQARKIARRNDITLVEGCGGWEVPLTARRTTADFYERLGAPLVLVASTTLGTINHTLLTLEAIRRRGLEPLGIVLNRVAGGKLALAEKTNPPLLARFSQCPIWGPVPYRRAIDCRRLDRVDETDLPDVSEIARKLLVALKKIET